jgi:hypothetical protein
VSCGSYLPTFRDNVFVPSSRVKSPSGVVWQLFTDVSGQRIGRISEEHISHLQFG